MTRLAVICALLVLAGGAAADEVYERIAEVDIGRVFLTPAQRRSLDVERLKPPTAEGTVVQAGEETTAAPGQAKREAAGYIISSKGGRREWSGSDFVATGDDALVERRFPGEVRIVRHRAVAENGDEDDE